MNIAQLIAAAKAATPALADLSDDKCRALLLAAFRTVRQAVNAADEGEVAIGGLGTFRVRNVEREQAGRTVTVRRVVFQVATPATGAAQGGTAPAAGGPAAKKVAAKKVAAKKVAAKKVAAVKTPAMKTPAAKRPAMKQAAAKRAAFKTPAGRRP